MSVPRPPIVAVLNNDPDMITVLATWLERHGMRAVCGSLRDFRRGHEDVAEFISRHHPTAILFDITAPYASNWDYLAALRMLPESLAVPFIVTTPNKAALDKAVGPNNAIEVTGSPADLEQVTDAVRIAHDS